MTGKQKCDLLKQLRKDIAEANGIEYLPSECSYEGDCPGYCPQCDAEAKYIDCELNRLAGEGKKITLPAVVYRNFLKKVDWSTEEPLTQDDTVLPGEMPPRETKTPIETLCLSAHTSACLKNTNIHTVEALTNLDPKALFAIDGIGLEQIKEIRKQLESQGLSLGKSYKVSRGHYIRDFLD